MKTEDVLLIGAAGLIVYLAMRKQSGSATSATFYPSPNSSVTYTGSGGAGSSGGGLPLGQQFPITSGMGSAVPTLIQPNGTESGWVGIPNPNDPLQRPMSWSYMDSQGNQWTMLPDANGNPDPSTISLVSSGGF